MKKNILVVDDSALMRRVVCDIINSDSTFQVTDVCKDGLEAYEKLKTTHYDAVFLDVNMPRMDGLEVLRKLQDEKIKTTVIMISTLALRDQNVVFRAMELGAVDFVAKPTNIIEAKGDAFRRKILDTLSAVLKIQRPGAVSVKQRTKPVTQKPRPSKKTSVVKGEKLIALACSTGGPKALQQVIPFLPEELDAPVVLVQHMPMGFTKSMAERLDEISKLSVKEAEEGEILRKGYVYVAPGGKHIEVARLADGKHKIAFNDMPAIGGLKPCANIMYDSLTKTGYDEIVCVILTGMGADGTSGILSLEKRKSIYVISQDAKSCVVYGMPKAVYDAGVVDEVVPLTEVAATITKRVGVH
ncbi:MAG: chemotaxis-specific protein-glutamate methyltransferase CheB [Roseburia sp.]|nr:chemotaxis-specific protein-glutamate methyltransferase CheB [Roseburia sp.]